MRALFAISIVCFCTVLWIALSLARRLRIAQNKERRRIEEGVTMEFFEAGEFRTPRPLRLNQEIVPKKRQASTGSSIEAQEAGDLSAGMPYPVIGSVSSGADIVTPRHDSRLRLVTPPKPAQQANAEGARSPVPSETEGTMSDENSVRRKSPQPARPSGFRRIDLSQYTEDMGDLTDPYTQPLRGSGTHRSASKNG